MEENNKKQYTNIQYLLVGKDTDPNTVNPSCIVSQRALEYSETLKRYVADYADDDGFEFLDTSDSDAKIAIVEQYVPQESLTVIAQSLRLIEQYMYNGDNNRAACAQQLSVFLQAQIAQTDNFYDLLRAVNWIDSSILNQALTIVGQKSFSKFVFVIKKALKVQANANMYSAVDDRSYDALFSLMDGSRFSPKITKLFWNTIPLMHKGLQQGFSRDTLYEKISAYISDKLGNDYCHFGEFIALVDYMQSPLLMSLLAEFSMKMDFNIDELQFPQSFAEAYYLIKFLHSKNNEELMDDIANFLYLNNRKSSSMVVGEEFVLSTLKMLPNDLSQFFHSTPENLYCGIKGEHYIDWEGVILHHFEKKHGERKHGAVQCYKEQYLKEKIIPKIVSMFDVVLLNHEYGDEQGNTESSYKKLAKQCHPKTINAQHLSLFKSFPQVVQDEIMSHVSVSLHDEDIIDGSIDALYQYKGIESANFYTLCVKQFLLHKSAEELKKIFEEIELDSFCKMILRVVYCEKTKKNIDDCDVKKVAEKASFYSNQINFASCFDGNDDPLLKYLHTLVIVFGGYYGLNSKSLNLSYNRLEALPKELFTLTHLESLELYENYFESVPREIGYLAELRSLVISDNEQLKELPDEIGNLTKLRSLDISGNQQLVFPDAICRLSQLESLDVANNDNCVKFPEGFTQLTNLRKLNISVTDLFDGFEAVISQLTNLEVLIVKRCWIYQIPDNISNLKKLRKLILFENHLESLPETMLQMPNLQDVDIRENPEHDFKDIEISQALKNKLGEKLLHD